MIASQKIPFISIQKIVIFRTTNFYYTSCCYYFQYYSDITLQQIVYEKRSKPIFSAEPSPLDDGEINLSFSSTTIHLNVKFIRAHYLFH